MLERAQDIELSSSYSLRTSDTPFITDRVVKNDTQKEWNKYFDMGYCLPDYSIRTVYVDSQRVHRCHQSVNTDIELPQIS